ncbi:MAG: hypothetical protein OXC40_00970 [Proteobacteria bacterium]|nr:hypothetical protein [Pseudomonadota bacterium]
MAIGGKSKSPLTSGSPPHDPMAAKTRQLSKSRKKPYLTFFIATIHDKLQERDFRNTKTVWRYSEKMNMVIL